MFRRRGLLEALSEKAGAKGKAPLGGVLCQKALSEKTAAKGKACLDGVLCQKALSEKMAAKGRAPFGRRALSEKLK